MRSSRPWLQPPRNLLVLLGVITIGSAAAFGWLGWEMLRQDADAEAQREQERLGHEADRAAQAMVVLRPPSLA